MAPNETTEIEKTSVLRLKDVIRRIGLQRASIYRGIAAGTFPPPIALGKRARGWLERDVEGWIASRAVQVRKPQSQT